MIGSSQATTSASIASIWSQSDAFSRTYTMIGLAMLLLVLSEFIFKCFALTFFIMIYLPLFWYVEVMLSDVMKKMAVSSSYFNRKPIEVIPYIFGLLIVVILGGLFCRSILKSTTLLEAYFSSLFASVLIFMISSILKSILIVTGITTFKHTRRGFFGVFQRLFLIIRNLVVTPIWIQYFSSQQDLSLADLFVSVKTPYCVVYIVMKCFVQLWLLWNFSFSLRDYRENAKAAFVSVPPEEVTDDCCVCLDAPTEPVRLACGHIFCYRCVFRWLTFHNTCPLCCKGVAESRQIEFADGFMPLAALFSSF
ncbi:hypothetical protein TRFO_21011 [Tritrichomonas foetus]|uniref:RING-type domain-containing protein n=1 Tax=Tritrichomonas foetus TaxID=1144522 RepID=A0A1J4KES0_9EUKA|nr:hypothetical protein TRFO_21011 [Tritrichomonas foetus]|eukprot:OHT09927.1 hypothetical protein TRFO_21011 [Tritrichomonas foetus]